MLIWILFIFHHILTNFLVSKGLIKEAHHNLLISFLYDKSFEYTLIKNLHLMCKLLSLLVAFEIYRLHL